MRQETKFRCYPQGRNNQASPTRGWPTLFQPDPPSGFRMTVEPWRTLTYLEKKSILVSELISNSTTGGQKMGRKQHFVPQFLLRHFSADPKQKLISLFYLPESKIIKGVSIRDQAYKKNLYGSDQNLEKCFRTIETRVSVIINRIIQAEVISLAPEEDVILRYFVSLQINRTPEKISGMQSQFDKMMKVVFRHDPRVKDYLKDFTIKMTLPYHFMFLIALEITPVLFDLKVSLLKNDSEEDILIGQHPAVVTNPLLYLKKWPGSLQGIGSKGALVLLPISPKHMLALYDRKRYGLRDFKRVGTLGKSDVDKINMLQFCYTTDCVYFCDTVKKIDFNGYKERTEEFRASDKNIIMTFKGRQEKSKRSEIVMTGSKEPPIRPIFDFIDPKIIALHEDLGPTMDISREGIRDFLDAFEESLPPVI